MTRAEAVTAKAKLLRDPEFGQKVIDGDMVALDALKKISEALVGPEFDAAGKPSWQNGQLTQQEHKVTGF